MTHSRTEPLSTKANTLWNALGCMFYLGCQWLTTVLVVTLSDGYANSGALAFAMSMGIVFSSIALYKIRTYQVSDLRNSFSSQNYVAFRLITIIAGALLVICYLFATTSDQSFVAATLIYLLFKADESFSDVMYGIEQKASRMDYIGKSQILRGFASLAGFCVPLSLTGILELSIASMAALCFMVTLFYDLRKARLFAPVAPRIGKKCAAVLAKTCFLAMVASLCANSIVSVVRQYYGISFGDEALGIYASVATPAVLVQVAATYLYSPMIGALAKRWVEDGARGFKLLFLRIAAVMVVVLGVIIAILSAVGGFALTFVYGPSIEPYTYLFPYVLAATGAIGILLYVNDVLIIVRRIGSVFACNVIALVVSIASALAFVPSIGMNGINVSIVCAAAIGIVFEVILVLRLRDSVHQDCPLSKRGPTNDEKTLTAYRGAKDDEAEKYLSVGERPS